MESSDRKHTSSYNKSIRQSLAWENGLLRNAMFNVHQTHLMLKPYCLCYSCGGLISTSYVGVRWF